MRRFVLLGLLFCLALPVMAQNDDLARDAALNAAQQRLGTRAVSWSYEILQPTTLASLTCPTGPAGDLGRQVIPYRYTLLYNSGSYSVYVSSDGTTVVLCDPKFDAPVAPATVEATAPISATLPVAGTPVGDVCLVTATGAFVNVRSAANASATQVGQLFSGQPYSVLARNSNSADLWYYITPGWVSAAVVQASGAACATLPVDDERVGTGIGITAPTTDTNLAQILQTYACPPGFTGYLEPRIRLGIAMVKVEAGGLPNVIRSQPIANDSIGARLGTIQPNRTIDRVINGPVCSGGYVWWLVDVDNVQGWTVESDANLDSYFLELTSDAAAITNTPVAGTFNPPLTGTTPGLPLERREDTTGATQVAITADSLFALAGDVILGDNNAQTPVVAEYTLDASNSTFTDTGMALPTLVTGIQVLADGRVAVADTTSITLYTKTDGQYVQDSVLTDLFPSDATSRTWTLGDDGRLYALVETSPVGQSALVLRSVTSPAPLWSAELPADYVPFQVAFSPDTQTVAMLGFTGVYLFDSVTGVQQTMLSNATDQFGMLAMAYDPADATHLLTAICKRLDTAGNPAPCISGEITLWSLETSQVLGVVETNNANPLHLAYAFDGSRIYVGDSSGIIVVRDAQGTLIDTLDVTNDRNVSIVDMAVSRDGSALIASDSDGDLVWFPLR